MKLGFVLYKYFPFGGLQKDMMQIAQHCQALGHSVHIFTLQWQAQKNEWIHELPNSNRLNYRRYARFEQEYRQLGQKIGIQYWVGFNKMADLDIYYAADPCFAHKLAHRFYPLRYLPRYRFFLERERQLFLSNARILFLNLPHFVDYQKYYPLTEDRYLILPPGVDPRCRAGPNAAQWRQSVRLEFNIPDDHYLLLFIGSGFKIKGLKRSLNALAALDKNIRQRCHLIVIGQDKARPFQRLAARLGIADQVIFLSGRTDVPRFLQAADLLLHPAHYEAGGMVLLEAVVAGLPVLTTASCGYAKQVIQADAGRVLAEPFQQSDLNRTLAEMLLSDYPWRQNGIVYGQSVLVDDRYRIAAEYICHDSY